MKAIIYTQYGGPDMLHLAEIDKPVPTDNELLIRVHAVSVNDWDWGKLHKSWFNNFESGFGKPKKQILGSDIAGTIESVGKNVTKFKAGDEVYGDLSGRWGGFAEYVCAEEKSLALKPPSMSFEQAASIPQAAMLAVQGLIDKGKIQKGQTLLINGAGGGVGTFGIQIARLHGLDVSVVDSGPKLEMLRQLGAIETIDYTKEDFTKSGKRYDLILDTKTNRPILHYLRALNPKGKYITVGGSLGRLFQFLLLWPFISLFTSKKISLVVLKTNKYLEYMNELFVKGAVTPVIDGPYPLEQVPEIFRYFGKGLHKGKIVIRLPNGK